MVLSKDMRSVESTKYAVGAIRSFLPRRGRSSVLGIKILGKE